MRLLTNVVIVLIGFSAFALKGAPVLAVQAQADEAFEYRVCKLLDTPFHGSITFGGADGCEWGMWDADGVTIESEKIRSAATGAMKKEDLTASFNTSLASYESVAKLGGVKLQRLGTCEGGWQITSVIRPDHPTHAGFYRCNQRLIDVETEGLTSVRQFDYLANKMVALVK